MLAEHPSVKGTYLGRVGDHHVTVHIQVWEVLVDVLQDWCSHGDVWDKVSR